MRIGSPCQGGVPSWVGRTALGDGTRLAGAMAQLVAHLLCKQGVRGSSPLGSTYFPLSDDISWLIGAGKIYKYSNKYSHGATGVAVSTASRTRGGLTGCAGSMSGLELL